MMEPRRETEKSLNEYLARFLNLRAELKDSQLDAEFDLQVSTLHLFDIKVRCVRYNVKPEEAEEFWSGLAQSLLQYVRYLPASAMVVFWILYPGRDPEEDGYEPRTFRLDPKPHPEDIAIIFKGVKQWSILEIMEIKNWADLAYSGMHSNSATGMSVGGRRFLWIQKVYGFTRDEAEFLARITFGPTGLKRLPNGMYMGGKGGPVPPRSEIDE